MTLAEQNLYASLASVKEAREFLKQALTIQYRRQGRINLSDFSRRAGFASRSFLSEYLTGKKRLSRESFQQIKGALKLPKNYLKIFEVLVAQEQPELWPRLSGQHSETLAKLKRQVLKQGPTLAEVADSEKIICKRNLFRIFAGLGTEAQGASIADICQRTGLSLKEIQEGLDLLLQENIVQFREQRFYAVANQVDFLKIGGSQSFSYLVKDMCTEIRQDADKISYQNENFLFYSAFSVSRKDLPDFKEKLREAIYGLLDQYQKDDGDHVQQVFLCSKN